MAMGRFNASNLRQYLHPEMQPYVSDNIEWFYNKQYHNFYSPLKSFQYLDIKSFMGELVLTKIDRASMAHSLEVRVPFLDHELVEYVYKLHENVYFKKDIPKYLLRSIIEKALPASIVQRQKQGFVGPDRYYMNMDWYAKHLSESRLVQEKLFARKLL